MISTEMANSESSNGEILDGANKITAPPQVGNSVPYNIPNFPVLTALMWEAKFQWVNNDGTD